MGGEGEAWSQRWHREAKGCSSEHQIPVHNLRNKNAVFSAPGLVHNILKGHFDTRGKHFNV